VERRRPAKDARVRRARLDLLETHIRNQYVTGAERSAIRLKAEAMTSADLHSYLMKAHQFLKGKIAADRANKKRREELDLKA